MTPTISCLDRCNHQEIHTCQCDAQCEVFGDCCADFQTHCQTNLALDEIDYQKNLSLCTTVYHNWKTEVAYLISKCPSSWSEPIIRYRCSSHSINMHVYDKDGYNYRNIYCALCNNRTVADISFWDIDSDADLDKKCTTDLYSYSIAIKSKTFPLRGKIFRICFDSEKCPQTFLNASIINACSSYVYPVHACRHPQDIEAFKNPHCALCRGHNVSELQQDCLLRDFLGVHIWTFRSSEKSAALFTRICPVGEIADEISNTCQPILCATGYVLVADKCVLDNNTENVDFVNTWDCDGEMTFVIFRGFQYTRSCIEDKFKRHLNDYELPIFKQQASEFEGDFWTALKITNKNSRKLLHTIRDDSNSNILHDLHGCQLNEIEIISICNRNNHECSGQWISGSPSEFQRVNGVSNSTDVYLKNTMYFTADVIIYTLHHDFQKQNQNSYEETLFCAHVIDVPFLNCAMIRLLKGEYSFNMSGLYYMDRKLETGEYILLPNGHAQVCLSVIEKQPMQSSKTSKHYRFVSGALDVVHFSSTSLSIMGLIGTLVTYIKFKKLRNLHGVGIISLSLALLLANTLTVLSDKIPLSGSVCIAFAAITHFFWLAGFTWMNLISAIMIDAFVLNRTKLLRKSLKAVSVILLTGWSAPLLIVLLLLFLQFCRSCFYSDIIIYDGISTCWLATPTVNLYAFGIPVVLSLTINLALLTTTLISLHVARKKSNLLQHKRENKDSWKEVLLFLKVSWQIGLIDTYALLFMKVCALCNLFMSTKLSIHSLFLYL